MENDDSPEPKFEDFIEGPYSELGPWIQELPPEDARKLFNELMQAHLTFEEKSIRVVEQGMKFLVVLNGGGLVLLLGLATSLAQNKSPVLPLFPGALSFILGLLFCGRVIVGLMTTLSQEMATATRDLYLVQGAVMRPLHLINALKHRRSPTEHAPITPYMKLSFMFFILGSLSSLAGTGWEEFDGYLEMLLNAI